MTTDAEFAKFFANAIDKGITCEIAYDGQRIIEPHALGRGSEGQYLLRAFQREGDSTSTPTKEGFGWRLFRLSALNWARPRPDIPFDGPREHYKRGDKAMKGGIIAELLAPTPRK